MSEVYEDRLCVFIDKPARVDDASLGVVVMILPGIYIIATGTLSPQLMFSVNILARVIVARLYGVVYSCIYIQSW